MSCRSLLPRDNADDDDDDEDEDDVVEEDTMALIVEVSTTTVEVVRPAMFPTAAVDSFSILWSTFWSRHRLPCRRQDDGTLFHMMVFVNGVGGNEWCDVRKCLNGWFLVSYKKLLLFSQSVVAA